MTVRGADTSQAGRGISSGAVPLTYDAATRQNAELNTLVDVVFFICGMERSCIKQNIDAKKSKSCKMLKSFLHNLTNKFVFLLTHLHKHRRTQTLR